MKRERRAFKVLYNHKFLTGKGVAKSDYYETSDGGMIDSLIRSQGALEIPLRDRPPIPDGPLETQPEPDREPEVDSDVVGEQEPDWDFRTISDMKMWLSACGVEFPNNALKAAYVELCKGAWKEGLRPSPFWGLPGGPEVAPGLPGPNADDIATLEDAVATAEAAGLDVPQELVDHLAALIDAQDAPPLNLDPPSSEGATEGDTESEDSDPVLDAMSPEELAAMEAASAKAEAELGDMFDGADPPQE